MTMPVALRYGSSPAATWVAYTRAVSRFLRTNASSRPGTVTFAARASASSSSRSMDGSVISLTTAVPVAARAFALTMAASAAVRSDATVAGAGGGGAIDGAAGGDDGGRGAASSAIASATARIIITGAA